ncbi:2Fe-2S iron-sulfur cluster-binding protein [Planctomycetota bacterium]
MAKLTIDNRTVTVEDGATILDAAEKLGINIPTMCFLKGYKASSSCMVCVVKVAGLQSLVPACAAIAEDGMQIDTCSDEVREARKVALELLLSDHLGDCMGPCQVICPAGMDIPLMIRQIKAGKLQEAIVTVKRNIPLPAVLGRICPAPCENGCRRAKYDKAVSICLLKRYVADVDLKSKQPYQPRIETQKDKRIAIIGAGPAGLSAGYYLAQLGYACTIYDEHEKAGGMLRYSDCLERIGADVLDKEIESIRLNIQFQGETKIDITAFEKLRREFDAVFVATGADGDRFGFSDFENVFAGGDVVRKRKLAVRSVADGKQAAAKIDKFLTGKEISSEFNSWLGRLLDGEIDVFMQLVDIAAQVESADGFSDEQAKQESGRCLHCDCRKADNCKLRDLSGEYKAKANRYLSQRGVFKQDIRHRDIIYEVGKCIKCGLCVEITAQVEGELGVTFIGRGFDVRVGVPFDKNIADGLQVLAGQCVKSCPTGALSFKD